LTAEVVCGPSTPSTASFFPPLSVTPSRFSAVCSFLTAAAAAVCPLPPPPLPLLPPPLGGVQCGFISPLVFPVGSPEPEPDPAEVNWPPTGDPAGACGCWSGSYAAASAASAPSSVLSSVPPS